MSRSAITTTTTTTISPPPSIEPSKVDICIWSKALCCVVVGKLIGVVCSERGRHWALVCPQNDPPDTINHGWLVKWWRDGLGLPRKTNAITCDSVFGDTLTKFEAAAFASCYYWLQQNCTTSPLSKPATLLSLSFFISLIMDPLVINCLVVLIFLRN